MVGDGINDAAALRAADVGISVESAADAAKHAASLVVLTKNLEVITDGIRLGRKTLSNTVKYIRVTISANFGNMVSLVVASAFLPFLPLMPMQILLLNLLSDVPALTLASDNVDSSEVQSPRRWSLPQLRRFMVWFGLASSVIDISAFALLYYLLGVSESGFHSAWFVLSLVTECLILLVLRSALPLWKSAPHRSLLLSSIGIVGVGLALPFSALGGLLGFSPIPGIVLGAIAVLSVVYVVLNEILKRRWNRGMGAWAV